MRIIRSRAPLLETIQPYQSASFIVRRFKVRRFTFGWHYHPELELTYIVQGAGLRFVGDSIDSFGPGDLVLIGPNVPHTWQSDEQSSAAESIVIQFPADLFDKQLHTLPELGRVCDLIARADLGLSATHAQTRRDVFASMAKTEAAAPGSLDRLLGFFAALSGMAIGANRLKPLSRLRTEFSTGRAVPRQMKRVIEYLNDAIPAGTPPSQAAAARLLGMSPAAFSRFYRRNSGRTFSAHVNDWRIERACRALIETDRRITQIAFDCGFGNLSNFNRRFKQIKLMTPSAFRGLAV